MNYTLLKRYRSGQFIDFGGHCPSLDGRCTTTCPITLGKIMTEQTSTKKQNFSANLTKAYIKQILPRRQTLCTLLSPHNINHINGKMLPSLCVSQWSSIITPGTLGTCRSCQWHVKTSISYFTDPTWPKEKKTYPTWHSLGQRTTWAEDAALAQLKIGQEWGQGFGWSVSPTHF